MSRDVPTRKPAASLTDSADIEVRALALTIEWHPDLERIGETTILDGIAVDRPVAISRLSPKFVDRKSSSARSLEDDCLSRSIGAFEIAVGPRDRVELRPGPGSPVPVEVEGAVLVRGIPLAPAELEAGVIIQIGRRIVLALHRLTTLTTHVDQADDLGLVGPATVSDESAATSRGSPIFNFRFSFAERPAPARNSWLGL